MSTDAMYESKIRAELQRKRDGVLNDAAIVSDCFIRGMALVDMYSDEAVRMAIGILRNAASTPRDKKLLDAIIEYIEQGEEE